MNARSPEHLITGSTALYINTLPLLPVSRSSEWQRWGISFALILAVHVGLIAAAHTWNNESPAPAVPMGAVMIDFTPLPQEAPEQIKSLPPPKAPDPVEEKIPELKLPPPKVKPVVELPKKPPVVKPPKRESPKETPKDEIKREPLAKENTVAPINKPTDAKATAAPRPAAIPQSPSNALPTWQGQVLAYLAREKQYPRAARARRQEGMAKLRFLVDTEGKVLSYSLEQSTGHSLLDREVIAMIERIKRFPPPPSEVKQAIELAVPVQFYLH